MKIFLLVLFIMNSYLPVTAAEVSPTSLNGPFYLEISVVNDFPTQGWQGYNFGGGGQLALGYELDTVLSSQMNVTDLYYNNPTTGLSDNEIRIYPELKLYFFSPGDIRPYLIGGTGIDFQMLNGSSATSWIAEGGLGLEWMLKSSMSLFVEAKWNWMTGTALNNTLAVDQDIPLLWGLRFAL